MLPHLVFLPLDDVRLFVWFSHFFLLPRALALTCLLCFIYLCVCSLFAAYESMYRDALIRNIIDDNFMIQFERDWGP